MLEGVYGSKLHFQDYPSKFKTIVKESFIRLLYQMTEKGCIGTYLV